VERAVKRPKTITLVSDHSQVNDITVDVDDPPCKKGRVEGPLAKGEVGPKWLHDNVLFDYNTLSIDQKTKLRSVNRNEFMNRLIARNPSVCIRTTSGKHSRNLVRLLESWDLAHAATTWPYRPMSYKGNKYKGEKPPSYDLPLGCTPITGLDGDWVAIAVHASRHCPHPIHGKKMGREKGTTWPLDLSSGWTWSHPTHYFHQIAADVLDNKPVSYYTDGDWCSGRKTDNPGLHPHLHLEDVESADDGVSVSVVSHSTTTEESVVVATAPKQVAMAPGKKRWVPEPPGVVQQNNRMVSGNQSLMHYLRHHEDGNYVQNPYRRLAGRDTMSKTQSRAKDHIKTVITDWTLNTDDGKEWLKLCDLTEDGFTIDRIISRNGARGGTNCVWNLYLMGSRTNSHFGDADNAAKERFVGSVAWKTAIMANETFRDLAENVFDFEHVLSHKAEAIRVTVLDRTRFQPVHVDC
jgi:hypothetical protein